MRGVTLSKGQRHPEVIIIYTPGDGQAHMVGIHRDVTAISGYKCSAWTFLPERDLNGFLGELLESGFGVLDVRRQAKLQSPGMEKATPIVINRGDVSIMDAANLVKRFHSLLVDEANAPTAED